MNGRFNCLLSYKKLQVNVCLFFSFHLPSLRKTKNRMITRASHSWNVIQICSHEVGLSLCYQVKIWAPSKLNKFLRVILEMINSKTKEKTQGFLLVCINNQSKLLFTYQPAIKKLNQHKTNTQLFGSVSGIEDGMRCEKETKTTYSYMLQILAVSTSGNTRL